MKRQLQGKMNYMEDFHQIKTHTSSKGEGVREYIHVRDRTDRDANDGVLSGSSLSPSSEPPL